MMISKKVIVANETGLHARPGNEFVSLAKTFQSEIEVENSAGKKARAVSLLKLMTLGIKKGMEITIHAHGPDELTAVDKLIELVKNLQG